jgi:Protein of unknown function (DUF2845)
MKAALALVVLGCLSSVATAGSIRCGSRLILRGSSSAELAAFCGEPTQVSKTTNYTGGSGRSYGASYATGYVEEIAVEIWTYNFGPDQLMERVRIENGTVVQIDSLGYGYNEP